MAAAKDQVQVTGSMEGGAPDSSSSEEESEEEEEEEEDVDVGGAGSSEEEEIEIGGTSLPPPSKQKQTTITMPPPPPPTSHSNNAIPTSTQSFGIKYTPLVETAVIIPPVMSSEEKEFAKEVESINQLSKRAMDDEEVESEFDFESAIDNNVVDDDSIHTSSETTSTDISSESSSVSSVLRETQGQGAAALQAMLSGGGHTVPEANMEPQNVVSIDVTPSELNIGPLSLIQEDNIEEEEEDNEEAPEAPVEVVSDGVDVDVDGDDTNVEHNNITNDGKACEIDQNSVISHEDLLVYFRSMSFSEEQRAAIITTEGYLTGSLLGARLKSKSLKEERDFVFLIAQVKWDPDNSIHLRALQTCYSALLGESESLCSAYGSHWEKIGFQGLDPSTDLNRSMGMFAILQVLHFTETHLSQSQELIQALNTADKFNTNTFFCIALGFSLNSITALRRGAIYNQCGQAGSVVSVVHALHHAQCLKLLSLLKSEEKDIWDHINSIRAEVNNKDNVAVKAYLQDIQKR